MHDLDNAMVAFAPNAKYFLVKGRFDWKSLRSYVEGQSGECINSLCRVTGSAPDRRISFLPVRRDLMAMAVSRDEYAVRHLTEHHGTEPAVPSGPVWFRFPGSWLKSHKNQLSGVGLDGARPFATIKENAAQMTLSLVPEGDRLAAKMDIQCRDAQDAAAVAAQLTAATQLTLTMIQREHQKPNPADASGILTSGTFRSEGIHMFGQWPIERAFIQNLLGTSVTGLS